MALNVTNESGSIPTNGGSDRAPAATAAPRSDNREKSMKAYNPFQTAPGMPNGVFGSRVYANSGSEAFTKVAEFIKKGLKTSRIDDSYDVFEFPREQHRDLNYSVIVIARNNNTLLGQGAPVHNFVTAQVWIMEATGEIVRPYTDQSNSRRHVTITPTTENAYNSLLTDYVTKRMEEHYAIHQGMGPVKNVYFIDPIVLPREVKYETSESDILTLLDSSVIGLDTRSQVRVPNFQDYNFAFAHGGGDLVLPVSVDIISTTKTDLTKRPIHSDATVTVSLERNGRREGGTGMVFNGPQESRIVGITDVAVDLVPVDVRMLEENRVSQRGRKDFTPEVAWAPRLTATSLEQFVTRTPAGIMFNVASMSELARDRAWAETYRAPKGQGKNAVNHRNIGYLNIEANLEQSNSRYGEIVNIYASDFDDRALGTFLDNTVARFPILAVDCMTTGAQAYTTTLLYNAARGNKQQAARANEELLNSMNDASNGELFKLIEPDALVIDGEGHMMHVGHWTDAYDKVRDLSEIDNYLGMAVAGDLNNPELVQDWLNTYYSSGNEEVRMSERLVLLTAAAGGGVTVTGSKLRVEVNAEVVAAFVEAMANAKLPLLSRTTGDGDAFAQRRTVARVTNNSVYRGSGFGRASVRDTGRGRERYSANRY